MNLAKLQDILYKLLQDFSIFFPFITEEIFQDIYHNNKSIHLTEIKPLDYDFKEEVKYGDMINEIIGIARGEKTNASVSLKTEIEKLNISAEAKLIEAIKKSQKDFKATLFISNLELNDQEEGYTVNEIKLKEESVE